jgi:predicted RNA-binding protein YlxR (DUF448 family)
MSKRTARTAAKTPGRGAGQEAGRRRHVPQRTCVGCRQVEGKRRLVRVVRTADGRVVIDPTGKLAGRGAYVHAQRDCWQAALAGALARALKAQLSDDDRRTLEEFAAAQPEAGGV